MNDSYSNNQKLSLNASPDVSINSISENIDFSAPRRPGELFKFKI